MKQSCPKCGKRHNKFPRNCYYEWMSNNTFAVITTRAQTANAEQKEWAKEVAGNWKVMEAYIEAEFPNQDGLKIETV